MTTREQAIFILIGVAVFLCLLGRDIRRSMLAVLRSLLSPKVLFALLSYVALLIGVTVLADRIGYWNANLVGATILWFIFTGLKYFLNLDSAGTEEHYFRKSLIEVVSIAALFEFFLNIRTFSIPVELVLQLGLILLGAFLGVSYSKPEFKAAAQVFTALVAIVVVWQIAATAVNLADHRDELEHRELVSLFALPIWLTVSTLPFIYVLAVISGYGSIFARMRFGADKKPTWSARLGVIGELRGRPRRIAAFTGHRVWQAGRASSYRGARQAVREFEADMAVLQAAERAEAERLINNAGKLGADDEGQRLDQREFKETREALQWLATCQMGWYQREEDGGRYRHDLLEILGNDFSMQGLAAEHGIVMRVRKDGQAWLAYRRTITGWVFAVGASQAPPSQWLYDGDEPPQGYPGADRRWGVSMFATNSANW